MTWEPNPRFIQAIDAIRSLAKCARYQAVYVFGSVAEGTSTNKSDLDVVVVIDDDNPCQNFNHPTFDDYKLDLNFRSYRQVEELTGSQITTGNASPTWYVPLSYLIRQVT